AIAVGADLVALDAEIRDDVTQMVVQGRTEVNVWGRPDPGGIGHELEPAAHPLSVAAKAFKTHALRATGHCAVSADSVAPEEMLFRLRGQPLRRLHSV
ncbi:MAG: hypothetical protein ACXWZL_11235, partial [Mycobacterium sp.]